MDKIDIRDLRVNNLVYSSFSKTPCKVTEIRLDESGYGVCKVTGVDGYKDVTSLSPIPVTPEILEKNRWKKQPIPSTSRKNCIGVWRDSKSNTTIKQFFLNCNTTIFVLIGGYSKVGNIKYFHQLQNILRDLGIEKEIII